MKVVYFHRKPRSGNFSVEILFNEVRRALPPEVEWKVSEASVFSKGLLKRLYIALEAWFRQEDINHITGDITFIAILLRRRRTVLTMLDLGLMNHPNPLARFILKWFWVILPARRSAVITTISSATKGELLKYANIDPSKVKVVYVPISGSFVQCQKAFNKDKPTILQIGTKPNKNVVRLVHALKGIRCRLDIVGNVTDELRSALTESQVEYTSSKNLTNEEILQKYSDCDILSFVSTYEGFGMPIVEANAVGRVVVTSNLLSMPEVAGDAAHLVDPFDVISIREGIIRVIQDDEYRSKLIANGFRNRKRFDAAAIASEYAEIYRELTPG